MFIENYYQLVYNKSMDNKDHILLRVRKERNNIILVNFIINKCLLRIIIN